jgi:ATP dependent DNA ligase domain
MPPASGLASPGPTTHDRHRGMIHLVPLTFVRPLVPADAARPPPGEVWLHEPKWDGYRFQVVKDGARVRLFSKSGAEYSERLPGMVESFTSLPTCAAVSDGEAECYPQASEAYPCLSRLNSFRCLWSSPSFG